MPQGLLFSRLSRLRTFVKRSAFLDTLIRYAPPYYGQARRVFASLEAASLKERQAYTQDILTQLHKAQCPSETRKSDVQANPQQFIKPSLIRFDASTSGSSGTPLKLKRSLSMLAAEQAALDHILSPYALDWRRAKVAVLRGDAVVPIEQDQPPYGLYSHNQRRLTLSAAHLSAKTAPWYIERLTKFQPDVLWIYPSSGTHLAQLCLAEKAALGIPVILSSSESLLPSQRQLLAETFTATVVDYYGQAERVCFAYSTQANVWHFLPGYGAVTLKPVPEQEDSHHQHRAEIIASSLWNKAMPLCNYRTGDHLLYPARYDAQDLEAVAYGCLPFLALSGRENEYLETPDGQRLIGVNTWVRELTDISQVQFQQHAPDTVTLCYHPLPTAHTTMVEDSLKTLINLRIPQSLRVTLKANGPLQTTASGKVPLVYRPKTTAP